MKVIDILNDIANGKKVPKNIKYNDYILTYDEDTQDYYNEPSCTYSLLSDIHHKLNDEIKIIEDTPKEDKKIEKLPYYSIEKIQKAKNKDEWIEERISLLEKRTNDYHNKINKIIDKVNGK